MDRRAFNALAEEKKAFNKFKELDESGFRSLKNISFGLSEKDSPSFCPKRTKKGRFEKNQTNFGKRLDK